jgi:hypothetical protein
MIENTIVGSQAYCQQEGIRSSDKNSLFDRGSIGEMGLWVKGKTSQHIVVMDKRVQRVLAIEARAEQADGNWR